jgi:predicted GNAT superfamily acetyltransferase
MRNALVVRCHCNEGLEHYPHFASLLGSAMLNRFMNDLFEWKIADRHLRIREVEGEAEYHAIEDLQKEAWQFSDLDTVPAATLIATQHAGGIVLGAFDGDLMIGFAYGFPALEDGRASMHSHMLAVKPDYRNCHAGFYLKLAQRARALEKGLDEITWTFDPLQSLNAHLNFTKLGVISQRYIPNFYGEATSSPLHSGFGTDRLWVRWLLNSARVKRRSSMDAARRAGMISLAPSKGGALIASALIYSEGSRPLLGDFSSLSASSCTIEIPNDINKLKEREPKLGVEWREATRAAFLAALDEGFIVEDFVRVDVEAESRWFYILNKTSQVK